MNKRLSTLVLAAAMIFIFSSAAYAVPPYLTTFQAKYPNARNITCGLCHLTPSGAPSAPRNPYGVNWAAGLHATAAQQNLRFTLVEPLDSDLDGFTNLTEITSNTLALKVLPGFRVLPAAFPAAQGFRPVPPRLVFFDNFSNAVLRTIPNWTVTGAWIGNPNRVSILSPPTIAESFAFPRTPAALINNFRVGRISAKIQLVSGGVPAGRPDADIVWSVRAAPAPGPNFRFVSISQGVPTGEIQIGQDGIVGGQAFNARRTIATGPITLGSTHTVEVRLGATGLATVLLDNRIVGSLKFPTAVAGSIGFRTQQNSRVRFDDFMATR